MFLLADVWSVMVFVHGCTVTCCASFSVTSKCHLLASPRYGNVEQTVIGVLSPVLDVHDKSYPRAKLVELRLWKMYL